MITLFPIGSIYNSVLDYRDGIQRINSSIVEFRDGDDVKAIWFNKVNSVSGLEEGTWEARTESGQIFSFENPPISFTHRREKYFYESEFGKPMQITYLKHLKKILAYKVLDP